MPAKQEAKTYQLMAMTKKQYSHVLGIRNQYKKQHPYPKLGQTTSSYKITEA
jgi:hypothetical protein